MQTNEVMDETQAEPDEYYTPVSIKKRRAPDSGHSPEERRLPQITQQTDEMTDQNHPTNSENTEVEKQIASRSKAKYSFIVEGSNEINLPKIDEIIGTTLDKTSVIIFSKPTKNKKAVLYRTRSTHGDPSHDLNFLSNEERLTSIRQRYGDDSIDVVHHDPTKRNQPKREENHAIAKHVPVEYEEDEFLRQVHDHNSNLREKIVKVSRIRFKDSGKPTLNIRVICSDKITSENLINNGLKINCRIFKCEKPKIQPMPRMCYRCQMINPDHLAKYCQGQQRCTRCSEEHRTGECRKPKEQYCCINCGENHAAWSAKCKKIIEAREKMIREEEEKKKASPSAQPVSRATMSTYVKQVTTNQKENQVDISNKLDSLKHECTKMINNVKNDLQKHVDEKFEGIIKILNDLSEKIDTSQLVNAGPHSSPANKATISSYSKLTNKVDSVHRKIEIFEAKLSTMPTKIKDEMEELINAKISEEKNKLHNHLKKSTEETQKAYGEITITLTKLQEKQKHIPTTKKIEEIVNTQMDDILNKKRTMSLDRRRSTRILNPPLLLPEPDLTDAIIQLNKSAEEVIDKKGKIPVPRITIQPGSKGGRKT